MHRYYSKLRPVGIGTYPVGGAVETFNYQRRQYVEDAGCEVWGYIDYDRELEKDELFHYDLVPGGLNEFWVVMTSVYDNGRVTASIVGTERHAQKPESKFKGTRYRDIYTDYFSSRAEAEAYIRDSQNA